MMRLPEILLIVLVVLLFGILPVWPHSRRWGRLPSGIVGFLIIVLLIMVFVH